MSALARTTHAYSTYSEGPVSALGADRHERPIAAIGTASVMLRSQPALPPFAARPRCYIQGTKSSSNGSEHVSMHLVIRAFNRLAESVDAICKSPFNLAPWTALDRTSYSFFTF